MNEAPQRSTADDSLDTKRLFRDAAANIVRRRDAAVRGEAPLAAGDDATSINLYGWRDAALRSQREVSEIMDHLLYNMSQPTKAAGPACLAAIQTKDQLRQFLLDLLLPELVEIIQGVIEGMHNGNAQLPSRSEEDGSVEGESNGEAVADAGETPKCRKEWTDGREIEIPF